MTGKLPRTAAFSLLLACAAMLAGCSIAAGGNRGRAPTARPGQSAGDSSAQALRVCEARLAQAGATFSAVPDRYPAAGCSIVGTVQLSALASDDSRVGISQIGPVTCELGQAFAGWARFGADRAARQFLGQKLRAIETFGSYSCRDVAGSGRRSAHATAAAIDVSAFVLADGRRITIKEGWDGRSEADRQFLRVVHQSACRRFATVLGPAYNAAHRDHLHLEGVVSGRSYCR